MSENKMPSIRKIAELSGCSIATVSRYLNKTTTVSVETAEKIERVINATGYIPNELTSGVFGGKTNTIGLIVQNVDNPFFSQLLKQITFYCTENGISLITTVAENREIIEKEIYENLIKKRVDVLIVVNTSNPEIYKKTTVPIIAIDKRIYDNYFIESNCVPGFEAAFEKIDLSTCKKALFIGAPGALMRKSECSKDRELEFKVLCEKYKLDFSNMYLADTFDSFNKVFDDELLEHDVIFAWNDFIAHIVCAKLRNRNIVLGQDIQVVGYDGLELNKLFDYNLSTIFQDVDKIGCLSIMIAIKLMSGTEVKEKDFLIDTTFISGNTTKNI